MSIHTHTHCYWDLCVYFSSISDLLIFTCMHTHLHLYMHTRTHTFTVRIFHTCMYVCMQKDVNSSICYHRRPSSARLSSPFVFWLSHFSYSVSATTHSVYMCVSKHVSTTSIRFGVYIACSCNFFRNANMPECMRNSTCPFTSKTS